MCEDNLTFVRLLLTILTCLTGPLLTVTVGRIWARLVMFSISPSEELSKSSLLSLISTDFWSVIDLSN